jgi:hypothetical protein
VYGQIFWGCVLKNSSVEIGTGIPCPVCEQTMTRFEHHPGWKPKPGKYWFKWWDRCLSCGFIQHFEAAKVIHREGH